METQRKEKNRLMPPYAGYQTHTFVLERVRQFGIPSNLGGNDIVRDKLSDSTYSQVIRAWRYLGLVDLEGEPQENLSRLIEADGEEYQQILREVLVSSYHFLFGADAQPLDLANTTMSELTSRFEKEGATGSTIRRGVFFFVNLAKESGMSISDDILGEQWPAEQEHLLPVAHAYGTSTARGTLSNSADVRESESRQSPQRILMGKILLSKLPDFNPGWSSEVQKTWLESFNQVLHIVRDEKVSEL